MKNSELRKNSQEGPFAKIVNGFSSVKWTVLAHLKSQPRGQKFQAQI